MNNDSFIWQSGFPPRRKQVNRWPAHHGSSIQAAVPGGYANLASGSNSFAASQNVQANHDGSFVWNDGVNGAFGSWEPNRFQVHATNGAVFESTTLDKGAGLMVKDHGNGIYANTDSYLGIYYGALYAWNVGSDLGEVAGSSGTYAGYFNEPIYVNGGCVACTLVQVGQNAG